MNSQNILKFWGSKLDLQLDSSEYYDYEISKTELDYDDLVLDLDNTIVYTGLTINTTGLSGTDCTRDTISLVEYNNTVNDASYVYLGLSWTIGSR